MFGFLWLHSVRYLFVQIQQKNTWSTCQICSKITIRQQNVLMFLLLTLNIFLTLFYCYNWWIRINKFSFSNCEKYTVLQLGQFVGCKCSSLFIQHKNPVGIYLLQVNNRNTGTRCEICSKLIIKTPERRQWLWKDNSVTNIFTAEIQKDKLSLVTSKKSKLSV